MNVNITLERISTRPGDAMTGFALHAPSVSVWMMALASERSASEDMETPKCW